MIKFSSNPEVRNQKPACCSLKTPFFGFKTGTSKMALFGAKKNMEMYKIAKPLVSASNLPYDTDRFLENKPWTNYPISMNFR